MANTDTSILEIDETAKAQAEAAANASNGSAPEVSADVSDIKKQVSLMVPVGLLVALEQAAIEAGTNPDAKGHVNISGVVLAAAAQSVGYTLTAKEKTGTGIVLSDEDKAAKKAEDAAKRKAALEAANAAAAALRARMRATAQAQLANS